MDEAELRRLYQNYIDMTSHLEGERPSFEEYKAARRFVEGMMAETDAERIIKAEAKRLGLT
jgi:DNA-binding FadR family transcriptional regulator